MFTLVSAKFNGSLDGRETEQMTRTYFNIGGGGPGETPVLQIPGTCLRSSLWRDAVHRVHRV